MKVFINCFGYKTEVEVSEETTLKELVEKHAEPDVDTRGVILMVDVVQKAGVVHKTPDQIKEERELIELSGESSLRVLDDFWDKFPTEPSEALKKAFKDVPDKK